MYDYHSHTDFSDDSQSSMDDMICAAIDKGVVELAITDHYDPDYPDPEFPFEPDLDQYFQELIDKKAKYAGQIKIIKGLEIGIQGGTTMNKCKDTASRFPWDFLIGSFHCFNGLDLYTADFEAFEKGQIPYLFYEEMFQCLSAYKDYDVIGHFNVIDRYIPSGASYKSSMEVIEAILKMIIYDGKGLEINTSSYRYNMGQRTTPADEILAMYKSLGGEILTLGSDSHKPAHMAMDLDRAAYQASKHGFKYLATYQDRQVSMVNLTF